MAGRGLRGEVGLGQGDGRCKPGSSNGNEHVNPEGSGISYTGK